MKNVIEKKAVNYSVLEGNCEATFLNGGPYWHLCTPGQFTELLFETDEDYRFIMNTIAIASAAYKVVIITFEVMSNHLHFILEGEDSECRRFFDAIKRRLRRYYSTMGRFVDLSAFTCKLIPIEDLRAMRIEIVYVNRNGYLSNESHTPFSYPWGSGCLYFSKAQFGHIKYADLTDLQKRRICRGRPAALPDSFLIIDSIIDMASFCAIKKGMAFYRNAHHYFSLLAKNYEAYSEIAKRLGDDVFLSDDEMFAVLTLLSKKEYGGTRPAMLPVKDKLHLARRMRSEYNASEGQIQRMLRLDRNVIAELFGK